MDLTHPNSEEVVKKKNGIIPVVIYVSYEQYQLTAPAQDEAITDIGPTVIIYFIVLRSALCTYNCTIEAVSSLVLFVTNLQHI